MLVSEIFEIFSWIGLDWFGFDWDFVLGLFY
jgi:hypothetical protein